MRPIALITGASAGIGEALAREFARQGHDLVLIARDEARLARIAEEIRSSHGIETRVLSCDLSHSDSAELVAKAIEGRPIDILVHNAGFGLHGGFAESDLQAELEMVELQIGMLLRLTKLILPSMLARKKGRILTVSSLYAFAPAPQQLVYGACKTFLLSFSESLAGEVRGTGVTVTLLCPGVTATEFRTRAGIQSKNPGAGDSPEAVARLGVEACLKGKFLAIPGFGHRIFAFVMRHLPLGLRASLMHAINVRRGVNR